MPSQLSSSRSLRVFLATGLIGTTSLLAGVAWDAHLHRGDPGLAASEGVLTLTNPGHLLSAIGVVLVVIGVTGASWVLWLRDRSPTARLAATLALAVAFVAVGATAVGPSSGAEHDQGEGHDRRGGHHRIRDYGALWRAASDEERSAAMSLVVDTKKSTSAHTDYAQALVAGYRPNSRGGENATHHPNEKLLRDGKVLDPTAPESLIYWTAPDGRKALVGVVYKTAPNEVAPAPGGALTRWHTHAGGQTCYPAVDDDCPAKATKMLHVFFFDGVHDPFAETMVAAAGGRDAFARAMRT